MNKLSENTKALIIFVCFISAFGCAGNGDYEYRKHQESKQIKHNKAENDAVVCK